ncbi:MAG: VOC family protein [Actinomycetales bacterium]|nr:VOC family protein [Actinomycetales bacterium]HMT31283.1 VOC family protein [Dermatophilaceae bacterium]
MTAYTTCLWFDTEAEAAAAFYCQTLPGAEFGTMSYYGEGDQGPASSVLTAEFRLGDQHFVLLNGGPIFPQSESASIQVICEDQEESDRVWNALVEGGRESQCGWLKDRWGVSWQVFPRALMDVTNDPDPVRAMAARKAMYGMRRIDLAACQAAADAASAS